MASHTEELHRLNRAIPIAFALIAAGIPSVDASKSNPSDWELAAQLAGMKDYTPSVETQKVIIRLLVEFEAIKESLTPQPRLVSDPEAQYLAWAKEGICGKT